MITLQIFGFEFGFDIWPTGEFRNWIDILQSGPGFGAAKVFWALDHRNVLSAWWYIAARPLIEATPAAPLILLLLAGLLVGLSAYLLLTEITGSRVFGLSVGILSALFIANVHRDGIVWVPTVALGYTLLAIWQFALFCRDRSNAFFLAASLIAWFIAVGTYSIQVGAIAAVFVMSLRHRRGFLGALADASPYAVLLALHMMIWSTTVPTAMAPVYGFRLSFDALAETIGFAVWNVHYQYFWAWLVEAGPAFMTSVFTVLAVLVFALLYKGADRASAAPPSIGGLGVALLIGICVIAPTAALEATSTTFTPGTRWPMVMEFWSPLVFCVLMFSALSFAPARAWRPAWLTVTAGAAAVVMVLALGFNRTQVVFTRQERDFYAQLRALVEQDRATGARFPRRYMIRPEEPLYFVHGPGWLRGAYARTILGQDVELGLVDDEPSIPRARDETSLVWRQGKLSRGVL
jgi:hypothetical protein